MNGPLSRFRPLVWVLLASVVTLFGGAAVGQTLTDTLGAAAIQNELQAQQAGGASGAAGEAQGEAAAASAAPAQAAAPMGAGIDPEPVFLLSVVKPILVLLVLGGWAWVVSFLDKDAAYYYLGRYLWNGVQMACGVIAFVMMLLIPFFVLGFIIGVAILAGGILGYAYYRNTKVPEKAKWTLSLESFTQRIEQAQHRSAQRHATLAFLGSNDERLEVPSGENPRTEAHASLEQVLDFAIPRGADLVQVEVTPQAAQMAARIDGVLYPQPALEPKQAVTLIDYLKEVAGLDVQDRRKRQHGAVRIDAGELGRHTLEIETAGSTRGISMTMNIDATRRKQMPLKLLGLLEPQKAQLQNLFASTSRVVLVSAPPRHGLTTTLYSLLQEHDPYVSSVITMEREVTLELEGVTHNEMGDTAPQGWNERLASILRSDPNVVMLDHLPDADAAGLIARQAEELRAYVGMEAEDTFAAVVKWVKAVGNKQIAAEALAGVTNQRLVRRLCMTCRAPYKPDPNALRKMNLPADRVQQFYHASGQVMDRDKAVPCPDCLGLGYKGRVGVFEVMVFDDAARSLLAAGNLDGLKTHLRKGRMLLLNEAGLAKVVDGTTDVKEITRTLGGKGGSERANLAPTATTAGGAATQVAG